MLGNARRASVIIYRAEGIVVLRQKGYSAAGFGNNHTKYVFSKSIYPRASRDAFQNPAQTKEKGCPGVGIGKKVDVLGPR